MPLQRFLKKAEFDQDAIAAMTVAFEDALRELKLVDRDDPVVELVAKAIIQCAERGDLDPLQMRNCALKAAAGYRP